jgi:hypothetical protein
MDRRRSFLLAAMAALTLALAGCTAVREAAPARDSGVAEMKEGSADAAARRVQGSAQSSDEAQAEPIPPLPLPGSGDKVIKTAQLSLRLPDGQFQDRFGKAGSVAEQFGGIVAASSTSETDGEVVSGSVTIRIPSDKFEAAKRELMKLGELSGEDSSTQDVTGEFVDLEARLRHARAREGFFLSLIQRAESVSDLIQIQQQLSDVQLEIEQIQGRLQLLEDQTSFSTITVRLFEPGAGPEPARSALGRALAEAIEGFKTVVGGLVVAVGWILPVALLALAGLIGWRIFRRPRPSPTA